MYTTGMGLAETEKRKVTIKEIAIKRGGKLIE